MLSEARTSELAQAIWHAEQSGELCEAPSSRYPDISVEDGYQIALALRDLKLAVGRRVVGHKVGLTSKAMRDMTGASEPDYGFIYDNWFVLEGEPLQRSRLNNPLVEVELAFVMKETLSGPAVNVADVIRATDFVLPALEIVDMRYTKPGPNLLVDSIADTAWCGGAVLGGRPVSLMDLDIKKLSAALSINGEILETGSASAVMYNPINAVVWLANKLLEFGTEIKAGDIILSGSFVQAVPINTGDTVLASYDQLGEITLNLVE